MKKWIKIIILVITIGLILTIADIVCILNFGKPLFAIKKIMYIKDYFITHIFAMNILSH